MSDKYVIDVCLEGDEDNSTMSMIDAINALNPPKKKKAVEPTSEVVLVSSISTKKKKKKKKKKSDIFDDTALDIASADEQANTSSSMDLLDADKVDLEDDDDDVSSDIIDDQRGSYKKRKKDLNEYKKEFAEEITLMYDLLKESSKFAKDVENKYHSLESSKTRGVSKYTNDLAEVVLSSKQNKLAIIKEITNIKKSIIDLKLKADAKDKSKDVGGNNTGERAANAFFKNILSHGRKDYIERLTTGPSEDSYDYESDDDRADDDIDDIIAHRLANSDPVRSEEGSKYIQYENLNVSIKIKKCLDTGDWEFIAIDKNGNQVRDYPVPDRKSCGRIKFSDDGTYATDAYSRMYSVIEYYLDDGDSDDDDDDDE